MCRHLQSNYFHNGNVLLTKRAWDVLSIAMAEYYRFSDIGLFAVFILPTFAFFAIVTVVCLETFLYWVWRKNIPSTRQAILARDSTPA